MRVLVFRASDAAAATAGRLAAAGHEPILAPVTTLRANPVALPAGGFDAILATSANAFIGRGGSRAEGALFRHLPVFAVGRATAEAARAHGYRDIRSGDGDAAALATLVRLTLPRPARLLYLAGATRKAALESALGDAGYSVETVVSYEAEAVSRWPADVASALGSGRIEAALHFSRRSAALSLDLARRHGLMPDFLGLAHVCLSEDVARPLREAGATRIGVAPQPDEAALLALLSTGPS